MCIVKSVGLAARNDVADVRIVQVLLNLNASAWAEPGAAPLSVDGQIELRQTERFGPIQLRKRSEPRDGS